MQPEQTVSEMVDEVLLRQAKARAARILETEAGRQLSKLRESRHRAAKANDWQEDLARAREEERFEYKRRRA